MIISTSLASFGVPPLREPEENNFRRRYSILMKHVLHEFNELVYSFFIHSTTPNVQNSTVTLHLISDIESHARTPASQSEAAGRQRMPR